MESKRLKLNGWRALAVPVVAAGVLAACGGGHDTGPVLSCAVPDQQLALRDYMNDWYFWYATHPNPSPSGYTTVDSYFQALKYTGYDPTNTLYPGDPNFPKADRWSYATSTAAYNLFFGDGMTLNYGVMVAGLEVAGHPELPLYIRYIEPGSPAAAAGLLRGDQILTINGNTAASVITADDYSALTPHAAGDSLTLGVRNASGDRSVVLSAKVYALAPVTNPGVVTTAGGRRLGYVSVKDMVNQALGPFDDAFAQFKAAGVQDVVIDLRYNGGGLVAAAATLASYPAASAAGQVYANLLYNDRHTSANKTFEFRNMGNALGLSRVFVLTGQRTCSASEQLINALHGLRPAVDVVTVGDTTCGKPMGFSPVDDGCGSTYSVVNFESVNAKSEGRYFDGIAASCAVVDDVSKPLGSVSEPLLAAAMDYADTGACPSAVGRAQVQSVRPARLRPHVVEPGDRGGMVLR